MGFETSGIPSKTHMCTAQEEGRELGDMLKEHNATNVIRMLTRILFVWFIKQKGLIPEELFDENELKNNILTELNPIKQDGLFSETSKDSVYYKAILQNLFLLHLTALLHHKVMMRISVKEGLGEIKIIVMILVMIGCFVIKNISKILMLL